MKEFKMEKVVGSSSNEEESLEDFLKKVQKEKEDEITDIKRLEKILEKLEPKEESYVFTYEFNSNL